MPDMNLGKLLLGKEQEKQVKDLLDSLIVVVALAQEVIIKANKSIDNINEITDKFKSLLK